MRLAGDILEWMLLAYGVAVFARIIIGWLPVRWPSPVRPLVVFIYDVTEPPLALLRRWVPMIPLGSGVALDLSPTVLLVVIFFLRWLVGAVFA